MTNAAPVHVTDKPATLSDRLRRLGDAGATAANWIAAVSLAVIVLVIGANVVGRYIFAAPLVWAEELMLYLMIITVFCSAVTVTWRQSHIRIEALVMRLPENPRRIVSTIVGIIAIVLLVTIGLSSVEVVHVLFDFGQKSDALEAPMWIPQSVITAGMFLIAGVIAVRLVLRAPEPQSHLGQD